SKCKLVVSPSGICRTLNGLYPPKIHFKLIVASVNTHEMYSHTDSDVICQNGHMCDEMSSLDTVTSATAAGRHSMEADSNTGKSMGGWRVE
ncbi:hypothetical protein J6590_028294, partial [Homalodisca vitripennis]